MVEPKKGKLIWSDEFESPDGQVNENDWQFIIGNRDGSQELQYYTNKNARVDNSMLIIETRKEDVENFNYTSARLESKKYFRYGVFEIRAKIPKGRGTWPAIWLKRKWSKERKWPDCGEIDIMEHVGWNPDKLRASIHCCKFNWQIGKQKNADTVVKNVYDDFHVYALDWNKDGIKVYVDGKHYFTYENDKKNSEETWPFDGEFKFVLNMAIGGNWAGHKGIDDSIFPIEYLIDYVRVYERPSEEHHDDL